MEETVSPNRFTPVSTNIQTKRSPYVIEGKINANKNHTRNSRGIPRGCSARRRYRRTILKHPKQGNRQPQLQPSALIRQRRKRQCTPIRHKHGLQPKRIRLLRLRSTSTKPQSTPIWLRYDGQRLWLWYGTLPVNQTATCKPVSFLFNRSRLIPGQDAFGDFRRPWLPSSKPHLQLIVA
jgi:hypothetical protein